MKKRIVFGITSLQIGGAERVLVDLANRLKDFYDITIFTIYSGGQFEKELDSKIKRITLYNKKYEQMSKIQKKIIPAYVLTCGKQIYSKNIAGKFDVEIAFLEGPITRIFSYGKNKNKIVWVHNDIKKVYGISKKAKIKNKIDKKYYSKYKEIIFVSEDNKKSFEELYNLNNSKKVIYNYIDMEKIIKKSNEDIQLLDKEDINIVTVARLVEQKAIDRFIKVHKKLLDEGFKNNVYVIGDGPAREKLEELINNLNVKNSFHLLGSKENPYPYIKQADYFTLLSNYEGYGMVIEEAKILNKPIIITNTAAKEAVSNYSKSIILENNEQAIFEGLKQVLNNNIIFNDNERKYNNEYLLDEVKKVIEVE